MLLLSFLACEAFHLFVDDEIVNDTAEDTLTVLPTVDIDWEDSRINEDPKLNITIANGDGYDFRFGIIESAEECSTDTEFGCWTAENCIEGNAAFLYTSPQGTYTHPTVCHLIDNSATTSLSYSADLNDVWEAVASSNGSNVISAESTGFPAPVIGNDGSVVQTYEFMVTYYLQATPSGDSTSQNAETKCWVWGADPSFYESLNCNTPLPIEKEIGHFIELDLD